MRKFKLNALTVMLLSSSLMSFNISHAYILEEGEIERNVTVTSPADSQISIIRGSVYGLTNPAGDNHLVLLKVEGNGYAEDVKLLGTHSELAVTGENARLDKGLVENGASLRVGKWSSHYEPGGIISNATASNSGIIYVADTGNLYSSKADEGGRITTYHGGTDTDTTVNNGGKLQTYGGVSHGAVINSGGIHEVVTGTNGSTGITAGGVSNDAIINGGIQYIEDGAEANNTTIKAGIQYVYTDGVANDTSVITEGTNDGIQYVQGGVANNTVVNGINAIMSVSNGGIASNVTVKRGNASVGTSSGYRGDGSINGITLTGRYANLLVMNGGNASNVLIDGGKQTVNGADATTDTVTLKDGSQVLVYGGTASHTYIEGGKQIVKDNSTTINTTIISGQSLLETGALAEGTTSVHQNGELLMEAGHVPQMSVLMAALSRSPILMRIRAA